MVKELPATARATALDGYRALAILVVMLNHAHTGPGFPDVLRPWAPFINGGVTAFWVLSGFLITRSLMQDEARTGKIDLVAFYQRQALRFYPPMLGYLALSALIFCFWREDFRWSHVIRVLLLDPASYCTSVYTEHLYSLVLQIQFCLLWPVILRWIPKAARVRTVFILALAMSAWHVVGFQLAIRHEWCVLRTDFFFGSLLMGSAFALADVRINRFFQRFPARWIFPSLTLAVLIVLIVTRSPFTLASLVAEGYAPAPEVVRNDAVMITVLRWIRRASANTALGLLVGLILHKRMPWIDRLLNLKPLVALGTISFSVYLWQNLFCMAGSGTFLDRFPHNLTASIACGAVFYWLVERPSLRWRSRVRQEQVTGTKPAT